MENRLTLKRKNVDAALNRDGDVQNAKIVLKATSWSVPLSTANVERQVGRSEQFLSKVPIDLAYIQRFVSVNEVNTEKFRIFDLGTSCGVDFPIQSP